MKQKTISTRPLSSIARHVIVPSGATKTDWPKVASALAALGVEFDRWQEDATKVAVSRRGDGGDYAAGVGGIVISIPRQVGKTFWVGALVFALCLIYPGSLVIWTAHRVATAAETFADLRMFAGRRKVDPFIQQIFTGDGDESIIFKNGSRILFGSRGAGFGRGFKKVKLLILDEAQILTQKTMEDMVPATNQADNPLIFLMGTPPRPIDPGEVFKARRREALSGEDEDVFYVEFSADDDAELMDRKQWSKANPSYPRRTPETAMLRMKKMLGDDASFKREALGIWDSDQEGSRAISEDLWRLRAEPESLDGVRSYAVAFSPDGSRASVGAVSATPQIAQVALMGVQDESAELEAGLGVTAKWLSERWRKAAVFVLSGSAGAGVLRQLLIDEGVPPRMIVVATTPQYLQACETLRDSLKAGTVCWLDVEGQEQLSASVAVSDIDRRGGWIPTIPGGDETPLESVSLALWGARTTKRKPAGAENRRALVL